MKQHGKKARQERALERLKKATIENSKGTRLMKDWEQYNQKSVPGAVWMEHGSDWQERQEAEIKILEERIARS